MFDEESLVGFQRRERPPCGSLCRVRACSSNRLIESSTLSFLFSSALSLSRHLKESIYRNGHVHGIDISGRGCAHSPRFGPINFLDRRD
jgi:hypothetical protein